MQDRTTAPASSTPIAVLDLDGVRVSDGRRFPFALTAGALPIGALLDSCRRHEFAQLWVMPRAEEHVRWQRQDWGAWHALTREPDAHLTPRTWCVVAAPGAYGTIGLARPGHESRPHLWRMARDGAELLEGLCAVRRHAGVSWEWSAGHTAMELLRSTHRGRNALPLPLPPPAVPEPVTAQRSIEPPLMWMRDLRPEERGRRWLWAYDKNGMYLGACASLPLAGMGVPLAIGPGMLDAAGWQPPTSQPGYWQVEIAAARQCEPPGFPPIVGGGGGLRRAGMESAIWVMTPTVRLLLELGMPPSAIRAAYVWPDHHQYLQAWYKRLGTARSDLMLDGAAGKLGARLALAATKQLYTRGIGWLEMPSETWRTADNPLARPDIAQAVRAAARANLYRDLLRLDPHAGPLPFAVAKNDTIYVTSDEDDAIKAAPAGLRLGEGLGQWKPVWREPVALAEAIAAIRDGSAVPLIRRLAERER